MFSCAHLPEGAASARQVAPSRNQGDASDNNFQTPSFSISNDAWRESELYLGGTKKRIQAVQCADKCRFRRDVS